MMKNPARNFPGKIFPCCLNSSAENYLFKYLNMRNNLNQCKGKVKLF